MSQANEKLKSVASQLGRKFHGPYKSCFPCLMFEMSAYAFLVQFIHSYGEQWSSGILWPSRVRFAGDKNNKMFSGSDLDYYEKNIGPSLPHPEQLEIPPVTGRLGQTIEQGTKRGGDIRHCKLHQSKTSEANHGLASEGLATFADGRYL